MTYPDSQSHESNFDDEEYAIHEPLSFKKKLFILVCTLSISGALVLSSALDYQQSHSTLWLRTSVHHASISRIGGGAKNDRRHVSHHLRHDATRTGTGANKSVSEAQARKDWYDNIMGSDEEKNRHDHRHSPNIVSENNVSKSSSPGIEVIEQWHDDDTIAGSKNIYSDTSDATRTGTGANGSVSEAQARQDWYNNIMKGSDESKNMIVLVATRESTTSFRR